MRVLVFDWTAGGHHYLYVERVAQALSRSVDVVIAVPEPSARPLRQLPVEVISLGDARPALDPDRPLPVQHRELAESELDLMAEATVQAGADHVLHLYADPLLRRLVRRPRLPAPTSVVLFFPRSHYPRAFGTPLGPAERARATFQEALVARFRLRADAGTVFTLDEVAARRWSKVRGAPVVWFPEPPVARLAARPWAQREHSCVLYGALSPRKGADLLAEAVTLRPTALNIVLAGSVEPGYLTTLRELQHDLVRAGARVELRARPHSEREGLDLMAASRCALLPYRRHYGMSRVLLEAASAATPVVAHRDGLLGHLVREYGLGRSVDCTDPQAFRAALMELVDEPAAAAACSSGMQRFSVRYSAARFEAAVSSISAKRSVAAGRSATRRSSAPQAAGGTKR